MLLFFKYVNSADHSAWWTSFEMLPILKLNYLPWWWGPSNWYHISLV